MIYNSRKFYIPFSEERKMSRANHIDYLALAKFDDSQELLKECIRLRKANPKWNWRQAPNTTRRDVLGAHEKILAVLERRL
jgi:hypothetical protein